MNHPGFKLSQDKIALLVFICAVPILGGIVGLLVLINGIVRKNRILIFIGAGGIIVTAGLVGSLMYEKAHRGQFDETRRIFANHNLKKIVNSLELYKLSYSHYPDSLVLLRDIENSIVFQDPMQEVHPKGNQSYYYRRADSGYYLFSRGFDAKPFTDDDLLPDISGLNAGKIGLIVPGSSTKSSRRSLPTATDSTTP